MYAKYYKRLLDLVLSAVALIVFAPVLLLLSVVGLFAMKGNPFFTQLRPGTIDPKTGKERIFRLIKFRSMTCERDAQGNLLSDEIRLTNYGKFLRSTSLDELPELINIFVGDMSIVGPRPQLVRDMVFMTAEQRRRHIVRQGLTGLAQINGRNNISWDRKLAYDLQYIESVSFLSDIRILIGTVFKVFEQDGITEEGNATAEDLGDYLLRTQQISHEVYRVKMREAEELLKETVNC